MATQTSQAYRLISAAEDEKSIHEDEEDYEYHDPAREDIPTKRRLPSIWLLVLAGPILALLAVASLRNEKLGLSMITTAKAGQESLAIQDSYTVPGFSWRSSNRTMMRWIPYLDYLDDEDARIQQGRFSTNEIPDYAWAQAPPSFSLLLQSRTRALDQRLSHFKHRKIVIAGCSLDRNALEMMCTRLGADRNTFRKVGHGLSVCHFKDLDLTIEVWFHFGTQIGQVRGEGTEQYSFEGRLAKYYLPEARRNASHPDLLLLASGAWDLDFLRSRFTSQENLEQEGRASHLTAQYLTDILPWEAYAYYRTRLRDMVEYLLEKLPNTAIMFRTETFYGYAQAAQRDTHNAEVLAMQNSAIAVMRNLNVPIFTWAEKLIGERDMYDNTHFRIPSAANWLYSDMLLYYADRAIRASRSKS